MIVVSLFIYFFSLHHRLLHFALLLLWLMFYSEITLIFVVLCYFKVMNWILTQPHRQAHTHAHTRIYILNTHCVLTCIWNTDWWFSIVLKMIVPRNKLYVINLLKYGMYVRFTCADFIRTRNDMFIALKTYIFRYKSNTYLITYLCICKYVVYFGCIYILIDFSINKQTNTTTDVDLIHLCFVYTYIYVS